MSRLSPGRWITLVWCISLAALGGCPSQFLDGADVGWSNEDTLPPGTYYLQERNGFIAYFELPAARGMSGEWQPLAHSAPWFTVGGFYRLSEDRTWSLAAPLSEEALDEEILLNDPLPADE